MRTIIAGSRTILSYNVVFQVIKDLDWNITEVISGLARGPDLLGKRWATMHDVPVKDFPALWDVYGKSAGFKRNSQMGEYADAAVVIWDGKSKGSRHMFNIMKQFDKPVKLVKIGIEYWDEYVVYVLPDGQKFDYQLGSNEKTLFSPKYNPDF